MIQTDLKAAHLLAHDARVRDRWHVVIAEDDSASRILLQSLLGKWGYAVTVVDDGKAALNELSGPDAPDIAILDWMMPKLSGIEVAAKLRSNPRTPAPYLILLTAKGQKSDIVEALDAGADDYIIKPFDFGELAARVRVARRSMSLQRELIRAQATIRMQAMTDAGSGALNRAAIVDALARDLERGQSRAVMLAAVDNYKHLEREHGVAPMDGVLRDMVQRVLARHPALQVGRYGTDQLLWIIPCDDGDGPMEWAEQVRSEIGQAPFNLGGRLLRLTISAGVSVSSAAARPTPEWLLYCADTALYAARSGGDQIELFEFGATVPAQEAT